MDPFRLSSGSPGTQIDVLAGVFGRHQEGDAHRFEDAVRDGVFPPLRDEDHCVAEQQIDPAGGRLLVVGILLHDMPIRRRARLAARRERMAPTPTRLG